MAPEYEFLWKQVARAGVSTTKGRRHLSCGLGGTAQVMIALLASMPPAHNDGSAPVVLRGDFGVSCAMITALGYFDFQF